MHSLIFYSELTIVEVVNDPSLLAETAATHLQYNLLYIRRFAHHLTQIY